MKSKISFFNKTLFRSTFIRFLPLWLAYAFIWIIMLPATLNSNLTYLPADATYIITDIQSTVMGLGLYGGVIMSLAFGALAAMAVFSHLYNAKSTGMMASLPIRREGIFATVFSVGLVGLFASNILVFFIALGVEFAHNAVDISSLLQWLAMVSMSNIFSYGFASLCAMLTGQVLVVPIVYGVLNFTVVVVEYIVRSIMSAFLFGLDATSDVSFSFLSPVYKLLMDTRVEADFAYSGINQFVTGYHYDGWLLMGIYCIVGVIFTALAFMLYRNRRMETASDFVAIKVLKPIFKYCLAGGCALCIGAIIYYSTVYAYSYSHNSIIALIAFMIIGGFIGYFAADMLMRKTFRVWKGNWKGFAIFSAVVVLFCYSFEADFFGFETRLPNSDEVSSVYINAIGEHADLHEAKNIEDAIALQESIVSNKDHHRNAARYSYGNIDYVYVLLRYEMKDGSTMGRSYVINSSVEDANKPDSDISLLNNVLNSKEAIKYRKELTIPVNESTVSSGVISYINSYGEYYDYIEKFPGTEAAEQYTTDMDVSAQLYQLTPAEIVDLYYNCILPDIEDGTLGRVWLVNTDDFYNRVYDCTISFDVTERTSDGSYNNEYFFTTPTVDSVRTNAWLVEHGIELKLVSETRPNLKRGAS